jgi:hypothetical protein
VVRRGQGTGGGLSWKQALGGCKYWTFCVELWGVKQQHGWRGLPMHASLVRCM